MDKGLKKCILVVSFGTSFENTRRLTIDRIEEKIKERFSEYEVRRAFTSHRIIKKLKEKYGMYTDAPEEALEKLKEEGFQQVFIQALHMIPGEEYDYIKKVAESYEEEGSFKHIALGRPALFFKGEEQVPDDYDIFAEALEKQLPQDKNIVLVGHGTPHPSNAAYSCLQNVLRDKGFNNVFLGTIDGYPSLSHVTAALKKEKIKEVILIPLLLVAGEHAINDMAGQQEDSWKSVLERENIKADTYMHGLGENEAIQDIYLRHLEDAIEGRYRGLGSTKKGIL